MISVINCIIAHSYRIICPKRLVCFCFYCTLSEGLCITFGGNIQLSLENLPFKFSLNKSDTKNLGFSSYFLVNRALPLHAEDKMQMFKRFLNWPYNFLRKVLPKDYAYDVHVSKLFGV